LATTFAGIRLITISTIRIRGGIVITIGRTRGMAVILVTLEVVGLGLVVLVEAGLVRAVRVVGLTTVVDVLPAVAGLFQLVLAMVVMVAERASRGHRSLITKRGVV
jgi:hypothetical protein